MATLLVVGLMNMPMMAVITVAIAAERLVANGARVARLTGWAAIASALAMSAQLVAESVLR